jgi:hypothetical protein
MPRYYNPYYPQSRSSASSILWGAIVLIIIMIVIYLWIRQKANNDAKSQLPDEYADETFNEDEGAKIRSYTTQIIEDLDGLNIYHNKDMYEALMRETDRIFTGVAVDYKRVSGESFRQALNDEKSFSFTLPQSKLRDRLISRFTQLNIF